MYAFHQGRPYYPEKARGETVEISKKWSFFWGDNESITCVIYCRRA
jgi:hypothetical protein